MDCDLVGDTGEPVRHPVTRNEIENLRIGESRFPRCLTHDADRLPGRRLQPLVHVARVRFDRAAHGLGAGRRRVRQPGGEARIRANDGAHGRMEGLTVLLWWLLAAYVCSTEWD